MNPQLQTSQHTFQDHEYIQRARFNSQIELSSREYNPNINHAIHRDTPISSSIIFSKPQGNTTPKKFLFQYFNPSQNLAVSQSPKVNPIPLLHLSSSYMMPPVELNTSESKRENAEGIVRPEYFAQMLSDRNGRKRDQSKYVPREDYERVAKMCTSLQQKIRELQRKMQQPIKRLEVDGKKTLQEENKELRASLKVLLAGFDRYRISLLKECRLLVDRYRLTRNCADLEMNGDRQF